jgi:hypothetical protein
MNTRKVSLARFNGCSDGYPDCPNTRCTGNYCQLARRQKLAGLQTTGLDALVLSDLAEALGQSALAIAIEELEPHSFKDEANGPWLYVLPNDLRDHLANLKADDLGPIARTWSQQEEAMARGMTEEDAARLLLQIQSLATTARNDQKPMLLWVSL